MTQIQIGTPLTASATRVILLGSGELGKEVAIELQRLGVEVIAVDAYASAPAMQVAHRSHVINMLDGDALRSLIETEKPNLIVPEVEAIATATLVELEAEGFNVIPTARATQLTMNREGIRRLAAEELSLPTSQYCFAATQQEFEAAVAEIGMPCVVKPIMSSSGKGQSVIRKAEDIQKAWAYAQEGGRAGKGKVIVEGFIDFDYEITLLTIRHRDGTSFCLPIGHLQIDGDYRQSWQPQPMSDAALQAAQQIAGKVTNALGGFGLFGVELFINGDQAIFSEVSPRPHDTGLVTLISQDLSEFALHARAILGLPIPNIHQHGPAASCPLVVEGDSTQVIFGNLEQVLAVPDTQIRLFGKPEVHGKRRMAVALARAATVEEARQKAVTAANSIKVS
ncbi:MAG: phosphoribosylglycinamide formyltransferase 2 [Zetaproteobacteria bacterium CG_4_9_14_3_um_filter_49_83]|nr:MAG: phosphoribosylglycinamide formyltransferase 2 [Zetaproteobacteria bacterium CG1_02_49_23]PIQ31514.1 MAG: phosphoribosylglycinamide formyltransferase 2 [Zetaproteobacteria bacterium CG17_big_fil_post_rev_8_21_14_2_50_50_13]PIV29684.1 MAG: phosphoribosylglycinamide formyltransferase 2 [Zetaproteobacteria bacterium CG02_land_8_20_14_3_00_50_9]PIY54607.1 MAG: phosphoribosylglycinamide formyltransferase 2 [Zetaproteobacteria bacterium CG_4_10_14_0_8_um_filter_49_80]PJA35663.1 MAG: phosphorib